MLSSVSTGSQHKQTLHPPIPHLPTHQLHTVVLEWCGGRCVAWMHEAQTSVIGVDHSPLNHISTEPTLHQATQLHVKHHKNRYMENQAETKQRHLNRTQQGGWRGAPHPRAGTTSKALHQDEKLSTASTPRHLYNALFVAYDGLWLHARTEIDPSWLSFFNQTWEMVTDCSFRLLCLKDVQSVTV